MGKASVQVQYCGPALISFRMRGESSRDEVQALLIEAAKLIEFLRLLLESFENIRLKDLLPQGRA
jgi:hypothetical protein